MAARGLPAEMNGSVMSGYLYYKTKKMGLVLLAYSHIDLYVNLEFNSMLYVSMIRMCISPVTPGAVIRLSSVHLTQYPWRPEMSGDHATCRDPLVLVNPRRACYIIANAYREVHCQRESSIVFM